MAVAIKGDGSISGFGCILQVVEGSTATGVSVTSTTYVDTGLTATITPKSASSKILVVISQSITMYRVANEQGVGMKLVRNSSDVVDWGPNGYEAAYLKVTGGTTVQTYSDAVKFYLDTPATTSALTYKTQGKIYNAANSGSVGFNSGTRSSILLIEVAT